MQSFLMPAAVVMRRPVSTPPVNVTRRTRGSATRASPSSSPRPVTTFSRPGGSPDSTRSCARRSAESGVAVPGFSTTALPPASAGPTLWQAIASGSLNGVMAPTTPTGNLK